MPSEVKFRQRQWQSSCLNHDNSLWTTKQTASFKLILHLLHLSVWLDWDQNWCDIKDFSEKLWEVYLFFLQIVFISLKGGFFSQLNRKKKVSMYTNKLWQHKSSNLDEYEKPLDLNVRACEEQKLAPADDCALMADWWGKILLRGHSTN